METLAVFSLLRFHSRLPLRRSLVAIHTVDRAIDTHEHILEYNRQLNGEEVAFAIRRCVRNERVGDGIVRLFVVV